MCNLLLVVGIHSSRVFGDVWGDWELVTAHITEKVMRLIEISTRNCQKQRNVFLTHFRQWLTSNYVTKWPTLLKHKN